MKWFQFTVAQKLWLLVSGLLAGMSVLVAGSLAYSNHVGDTILAEVVRAQSAAAQAREWRILTQMSIDRFTAAAMSTQENLVEHQYRLMRELIASINALRDKVVSQAMTAEAKQLLNEVGMHRDSLVAVNKSVDEARKSRDFDRSLVLIEQQLNPVAQKYYGALDAYVQLQDRYRERALADGARTRLEAYGTIAGGCACIVLLGLCMGAFICAP